MELDRDLFLPVSREDMARRGWDFYDFLLITGDAYVDHPSFGPAIIGRLLEAEGYRVSVVEYISPLDTRKNLLIRAVRTGKENPRARQEYDAVRRRLGTTSELDRRCMDMDQEFFVTDEDLVQ